MFLLYLFTFSNSYELIYSSDFSEEQTKGWSFRKDVQREYLEIDSRKALKLTYTDSSTLLAAANFVFENFSQYLGQDLIFTVDMKAEGVSKPINSWNGAKFMVSYTKNGVKQYPQSAPASYGTYDWAKAQFYISISENISSTATISFGLQESTGTIYFSNFTILAGQFFPVPDIPSSFQCEYTNRVKRRPIMRGVMSPSSYVENDLSDLRSWKASLIRWQIVKGENQVNFLAWLDSKMEELDLALQENENKSLGINFVVDFHSCPVSRIYGGDCAIQFNETLAQVYFESWRRIATRFKGRSGIWAYDLFNEPVQNQLPNENRDYYSIQVEAAKLIRSIDPEIPIIIESAEWDGINAYKYLYPLQMKDVMYEVHMYQPLSFTHQNVNNGGVWSDESMRSYPGTIDGKNFSRDVLEEILMPTIEFQKKYNARIFLGEFSAVRWAEGAEVYIEDVISIAEKYGWDWTYHAYREWSGWSVEHVEDHNVVKVANYTTKRKEVLLKYFEKNSFADLPVDDDDDGKTKKKLSGGQIAGIVIGVILGVAVVVVVVIIVMKKKNNDLNFSLLQ